MDPAALVRAYPEVYHMAERDSWPSIQRHGLLSTSALLDLFEIHGPERSRLESQWRPRIETISHPALGRAVIRDQAPMPERILRGLLTDMTPQEWYELINHKTFFWADRTRLNWMLRAYRTRAHCVLTVDTQSLLRQHLQETWLTDQNSGSTYSNKQRGTDTFKRVEDFTARWVAEVAVEYSVPDIATITTRVEEWTESNGLRLIWTRTGH